MKKSLLSVLLVSTLALTAVVAPSVAAADEYDQKISESDKKIESLKGQQASAQSQIDAMQADIDALSQKADELVTKQFKLGKETTKLQDEIVTLQKRIEKRQKAIKEQARDVQVNGKSSNFIDAVINAESISDAITRVQAMSTIVQANNDLVEQQKIDKKDVETKKAENEEKSKELAKTQKQITAQTQDFVEKQATIQVMKADLALQQNTEENNKASLQTAKAEAEAEAKRVAEEAKAAEEARQEAAAQAAQEEASQAQTSNSQTQVTTPSTEASTSNNGGTSTSTSNTNSNNNSNSTSTNNNGGTSTSETPSKPAEKPEAELPAPSGGGVIAIAKSRLGAPYVWGAKGPNSFDCSGFTGWVYRQVGREIGGWTVPQESAGPKIAVSQAQAGDLLFWGSPGGTTHVAISLGGGSFIHAPAPGQSVSIQSISSWTAPSFAVRM